MKLIALSATAPFLLSALLSFNASFAADEAPEIATPDEAKAMSEQAAEHVNKAENQDKAFEDFANKEGDFIKKDLYVFCMDLEGKMLSHAVKPQLVGKNLIDFDKYGDKLFQKMIEVAKSDEKKGWVDYKWPRPKSEEVTDKTSYIITNDKSFFCGVGAYKAEEEKKEES